VLGRVLLEEWDNQVPELDIIVIVKVPLVQAEVSGIEDELEGGGQARIVERGSSSALNRDILIVQDSPRIDLQEGEALLSTVGELTGHKWAVEQAEGLTVLQQGRVAHNLTTGEAKVLLLLAMDTTNNESIDVVQISQVSGNNGAGASAKAISDDKNLLEDPIGGIVLVLAGVVDGLRVVGRRSSTGQEAGVGVPRQGRHAVSSLIREESHAKEVVVAHLGGTSSEHGGHEVALDDVVVTLRVALVHQTIDDLVSQADRSTTVSTEIEDHVGDVGVLSVVHHGIEGVQELSRISRLKIVDTSNDNLGSQVEGLDGGLLLLLGFKQQVVVATLSVLLGLHGRITLADKVATLERGVERVSDLDVGFAEGAGARGVKGNGLQDINLPVNGDRALVTVGVLENIGLSSVIREREDGSNTLLIVRVENSVEAGSGILALKLVVNGPLQQNTEGRLAIDGDQRVVDELLQVELGPLGGVEIQIRDPDLLLSSSIHA
jgi:hypothetical protein